MEDIQIVDLYWQRNEDAIHETKRKYGPYCYGIAFNILFCREDALESENDTYLAAWNSMPPHKPELLSGFLGKLTRRISLDKWRKRTAQKRGGSTVVLSLDELSECIPDTHSIEDQIETAELAQIIDAFLRTLTPAERNVFLCRYWYLDSVADIGKQFGFTQSKIKSMLLRTRQKLRTYLEEREVFL